MARLKPILNLCLFLGVLLGLVVYVPRWWRDRLPASFADIDGLAPETSFFTDRRVPFTALLAGDAILFQRGDHLAVGWVAAVAGQEVAIRDQQVVVGGKPARGGPVARPDTPAVIVPEGRLYVVSDRHQTDSVAYGFLAPEAYIGKLGGLP